MLRHDDHLLPDIVRRLFDALKTTDPFWAELVTEWTRVRNGDLRGAAPYLARLPSDAPFLRYEVTAMHHLTELRLRAGYGADSDVLLSGLEQRRGLFVSWGIFGMSVFAPVTWLIASLKAARGDLNGAIADFDAAAKQAEGAGARPALAHVLYDHAFALVRSPPHRAAALTVIERCRSLARDLELPRLIAKLDALLDPGAPALTPSAPEPEAVSVPSERIPAIRFSLVKEGDTWTVTRGRHEFHLKDSRGLQMLAELVAAEGRELHVLTLGTGGDPGELGDAGEVLDTEAIRAYRSRLEALRDREREAEDSGDTERSAHARREIEALAEQLAAGVGQGGRGRRAASAAERARTNVQRRVKDAIRRIQEHDPELGRYLGWTVRTGTFCSFASGSKK